MLFLNTAKARNQVERYKQGVTRQRVNTSNFKKLIVALPNKTEQEEIVKRISAVDRLLQSLDAQLGKLHCQKQGLLHDLLSAPTTELFIPNEPVHV